jgi:hypothetical protein
VGGLPYELSRLARVHSGYEWDEFATQEGELTDFIDNFDMNKGTALGELARHKQTVVTLLERISKGLAMEGNLPSQRKFKEMQVTLPGEKPPH